MINENIAFIPNNKYNETNMVHTLFCAETEMDDDLIISYSDIIYTRNVLKSLIENNNDIVITIDKNWLDLWKIRMTNPLIDAETLKINDSGNIDEIGKKPESYIDIKGQYIGLIKLSNILKSVIEFYHSLNKSNNFDGKITIICM